jgi:hypothetical protein
MTIFSHIRGVQGNLTKKRGQWRKIVPVKHHVTNIRIWGSGGISPLFLTTALDAGELALRPGRFTPKEIAPCTHWIENMVGPTVGLDAVEKRTILPRRESNPNRPARRCVAIPSEILQPYGSGNTDTPPYKQWIMWRKEQVGQRSRPVLN